MKKTTVIFDLDGTLLYTIEDLTDGVNYAMDKFGYPKHTVEEVTEFVGNGIRNLIERSVPGGAEDENFTRVFDAFRSYYSEHCMVKTRPYEGIPELLKALREKGVKTGIVSNKHDGAVKRLSEKYFGDNISIAVGEREGVRRKPAPDSLYSILKELGSEISESVYVGDSDVDIKTAANAEIDSVIVDWGFRSREFLIESGAELIISNPLELLEEFEF